MHNCICEACEASYLILTRLAGRADRFESLMIPVQPM